MSENRKGIKSSVSAKLPSSMPFIIGNELAERFSFYGMKAILTTFLVSQFFNPSANPALKSVAEAQANEKTHLFISLAYLLPILGGIMADWFWGKYNTILYISLLYCFGHAGLAIFDANLNGFLFSLLLIAIGAGGIKPCVSANLGDQFDKSNEHLISRGYEMFYFSINLGSFVSTLLIPIILQAYGPAWAFGIPGILMAAATLVFWLGRNKYTITPPSGFKNEEFYNINFYSLFNMNNNGKERIVSNPLVLMSPILTGFIVFITVLIYDFELINNPFVILLPISGMLLFFLVIGLASLVMNVKKQSLYETALKKYTLEQVDGVKAVWSIFGVFIFIPFFWALYDQNGSEWVLQAQYMDTLFLGITWLPEQVQAINPILILILIPVFSIVIFPLLEKKGIKITPLKKITVGLFISALSFIIIALIQEDIDAGGRPNIIWQLLAFFILTVAEVLISITGLEYAYTKAPKTMKSAIMSFWLLTVSIGNIFVSIINNSKVNKGFFSKLEGATYYWFFVIMILVIAFIFIFVSKKYNEKVDLQKQ